MPYLVGLAVKLTVRHPGVQVPVTIHIAQGYRCAVIAIEGAERLASVAEDPAAVVQPDAVATEATVCHPRVEIAVSIQVAEGYTTAVCVAEPLPA